MAVTKIHPIKSTLKKALDYIENPDKTDEKLFVSSYGCSYETADIEFQMLLDQAYQKGNNLAHHLIQAFEPGETTAEQRTLQTEADGIQSELQQEEKKSVDVKRFLAIVKKYTDLTELTPEILREFIDKIIVHAPDKSSGRRLQEIEIIYNHIGEFDRSKVILWKGNAV